MIRTELIGDAALRLHPDGCLAVMPDLAAGSVGLVLADLPYGTTACKWDVVIPFEPLWEQYRRLLRPGGAVLLFASQPFSSLAVTSNLPWFRHEWVWRKNRGSNFLNTGREPMKEHEVVLVFSAGGWTYNRQMEPRRGRGAERVRTGFRSTPRGQGSPNYGAVARARPASLPELRVPSSVQEHSCETGHHPTQKPVPLCEYLIRTYSNPGDVVLDNTMGSGSTGVAAARVGGRPFVGIEKYPEPFAKACRRIAAESEP